MALRNRLLLLLASLMVGTAICAGGVALATQARDAQRERAIVGELQAERVNQLTKAFLDQQTGARGYELSGNPLFLEPYRLGRTAARRGFARLAKTAELRRAVADVRTAGSAWHQGYAAPVIAAVAAGDRTRAETVSAGDTGKRLFDALRGRLAVLRTQVIEDRKTAQRGFDRARTVLFVVSMISFAAIVLGLGFAAVMIRRWILRPLADLGAWVREARIVDDADTPERLPHLRSPELSDLALDVDAMRRRIARQVADAVGTHEALMQNAEALLALRSELESSVTALPRGWAAAADLRAAEGIIAGDCYQVIELPDGRIGVIVVDISGHGAVAGVLALRCRELIQTGLARGLEPGVVIETLVDQLGSLGAESFFTAFVAAVDPANGTVQFANAGHPPAFVLAADRSEELEPTGPLVGPIPGSWSTRETTLRPGDLLCVYTDGIIEARNHDREQLGPDRLRTLLARSDQDTVANIVERCLDEAMRFTEGRLHDDATIVVLGQVDG